MEEKEKHYFCISLLQILPIMPCMEFCFFWYTLLSSIIEGHRMCSEPAQTHHVVLGRCLCRIKIIEIMLISEESKDTNFSVFSTFHLSWRPCFSGVYSSRNFLCCVSHCPFIIHKIKFFNSCFSASHPNIRQFSQVLPQL